MSISFTHDKHVNSTGKLEHCMCAQLAPGWMTSSAKPEDIKRHANKRCPHCKGTGWEEGFIAPPLTISNSNAWAFMDLAGIARPGNAWQGSLTLPEARRALMVGRARFDRVACQLERPTGYTFTMPAVVNGTVVLRPLKSVEFGLSREMLALYLEAFALLVDDAIKEGATEILWS
jgi:hypothetical protein